MPDIDAERCCSGQFTATIHGNDDKCNLAYVLYCS